MTSHGRQWEELLQQICKSQYGAANVKKRLIVNIKVTVNKQHLVTELTM